MEAEQFFADCSTYDLKVFKNGVRLPSIQIDSAAKQSVGLKATASNKEYLKKLTWIACQEKITSGKIKQSKEDCVARLKMEFEVFEKTGTIDYLLLLMDIFLWCDKNGISRSPGRGSAAGSMALFVLGLTNVNPMDHDLNFTRFLNEARSKSHFIDGVLHVDGKSFADFDGDVSFIRRQDVLKRIEADYPGKTCKILTVSQLTSKMALKDVTKSYLEYHESEALALGNYIEEHYGKPDSLDVTYKKNKKFQEWADENKTAYGIARKLEGLERGTGQHASGVLVSYYDIDSILPKETASSGEIVCGMDMDVVLTVSLKVDVLGLRTSDIVNLTSDSVSIDSLEINIDAGENYRYLQSTDQYYGLFQISKGITKQVVLKVGPRNVDELAACISISRPGALKYIPEYVKFVKTGEKQVVHPAIDQILAKTGGLILFQEQINSICQTVYKMSAIHADDVRRCLSKKDKEGVKKWEPVLFENGKKENIPEAVTKWFWDTCNASADYLFNSCLAPETIVQTRDGRMRMDQVKPGAFVHAFNVVKQKPEFVKVVDTILGQEELYEVEFEDGRKIEASMKHKFLCSDMSMHTLEDVIAGGLEVVVKKTSQREASEKRNSHTMIQKERFDTCLIDGLSIKEICKAYTKNDLGVKAAYVMDKFAYHLKLKHNLSLKEYIIKYLGFEWPKCPTRGGDLGYDIDGRGVKISMINQGGITKKTSKAFAVGCERLSKERMGAGNPMYGKVSWIRGLTKETDERLMSISNKMKVRVVSEETKKRQIEARRNSPFQARHTTPHSAETKEKARKNTAALWARGVFSKTTSIHIKMREFLKTLEFVEPIREEFQVVYYCMDFAFPEAKIAIECQGSYYHVDPRDYPDGPINAMQRRNFGRDKAKKTFCCDRLGWKIIPIWEPEINDGSFKEGLLCKLNELNLLKK